MEQRCSLAIKAAAQGQMKNGFPAGKNWVKNLIIFVTVQCLVVDFSAVIFRNIVCWIRANSTPYLLDVGAEYEEHYCECLSGNEEKN